MSDQPTDPFFDQLRQLVTDGDTALALEQLTTFLNGKDDALRREALGHQSQLNALRKEERQGTISEDAATTRRNRINGSVQEFIDEVVRKTRRTLLPVPTASVSFTPPPETQLEKIIGAVSHLKRIAWLQIGLQRARSVCRVVTPRGLGTGFLIGRGWLLTNHHVIPDAPTARDSHVEFGYEEDADGRLQQASRYGLRADTVRASQGLDFCAVAVEQAADSPPLESWGRLDLVAALPAVGEHVTIIQHPSGGPKQIALTANQVVNVFDHRLQYVTDTMPGSSGSPVFNDRWQVVALHHAGGNLMRDSRGGAIYANEGILASHLLKTTELSGLLE
jgi:V8-like Glu-specific endopeptidase